MVQGADVGAELRPQTVYFRAELRAQTVHFGAELRAQVALLPMTTAPRAMPTATIDPMMLNSSKVFMVPRPRRAVSTRS